MMYHLYNTKRKLIICRYLDIETDNNPYVSLMKKADTLLRMNDIIINLYDNIVQLIRKKDETVILSPPDDKVFTEVVYGDALPIGQTPNQDIITEYLSKYAILNHLEKTNKSKFSVKLDWFNMFPLYFDTMTACDKFLCSTYVGPVCIIDMDTNETFSMHVNNDIYMHLPKQTRYDMIEKQIGPYDETE